MPYISDRVKDSTTTTGTGAITLSGVAASGGYKTFATAFGSSSSVVIYCIVDTANNAFEVGKGTFNGTTGLTRDTVRSSSNSDALVSFASGTKDVFCTASAELLDNANIGMQLAARLGYQTFL
jgi:hypothetical protein